MNLSGISSNSNERRGVSPQSMEELVMWLRLVEFFARADSLENRSRLIILSDRYPCLNTTLNEKVDAVYRAVLEIASRGSCVAGLQSKALVALQSLEF